MIYLYAFTDHPELPLPSLPRLGQEHPEHIELQILPFRDLAVIYSQTPASSMPPDSANIWRHESVVEALMADRTVLPVRFGAILENEANLPAMLAPVYPTLQADLQRLAGCLEVSLRALWKAPESQDVPALDRSAAMSGVEYMQARLKQERKQTMVRQKAEKLAASIHTFLSRLACESHCQVLPIPSLLLKAAYLIQRDQLAAFQQAVDSLPTTCRFGDELDLLCTGPWPPYSFTTALDPIPNLHSATSGLTL